MKGVPMVILRFYCSLLWIGVMAVFPATGLAAESVHLIGSVESLCPEVPYCFNLRVEAEYLALADEMISVRFINVTTIFDPENYELALDRSNIIPGSHLRLLLVPDPNGSKRVYQASYIWIGD
jgi:hypothetical protein